jgi:hypothetical protein
LTAADFLCLQTETPVKTKAPVKKDCADTGFGKKA